MSPKKKSSFPCIICSKELKEPSALRENSSEVSEILSDLFENFAKYMNWTIGDQAFNFRQDPFPFCRSCKEILPQISNLSQELEKICGRIRKITGDAAAKIICSQKERSEEYGQDLQADRILDKIEHFRSQTVREYSPIVELKPLKETTVELKATSRRISSRIASKKTAEETEETDEDISEERVLLKFPKIRLKAIDSIPGLKFPSDSNNVQEVISNRKRKRGKKGDVGEGIKSKKLRLDNSWKTSKTMEINQITDQRSKKSIRCPVCGVAFASWSGLELHQTLICGKYQAKDCLVKLNDHNYLFDGYPVGKIKGGFECRTCGNVFSSMLYTQFHIRKVHSAYVQPESVVRNEDENEDENENQNEDVKAYESPLKVTKKRTSKIKPGKLTKQNVRIHNNGNLLNREKVQGNILKMYANALFRMSKGTAV